jgi:hypothetical protein
VGYKKLVRAWRTAPRAADGHGSPRALHRCCTLPVPHRVTSGTVTEGRPRGRRGRRQYKTVEIQEASVRFIGSTAILLNKIRLVAVVGGNEVTNPFVVTEVYVRQNGAWVLGSLSFTRLVTP